MLLNISLIDRYIVKQLIRPWIFSVAICTVLGETIGITFEQISFISELEFPLTAALQVHLFKLPAFLSLALPFSILMAAIVVYSQLSRKNEIVALQSCGTSLIRSIVPAVILSSVLACLMFSLDAVIVPAANYKAAMIIENKFEIDRNDLGKYQKRNIIYQKFWDSEKQQDLRYLLVVDKVDGQKLNGFTLLNFERNNLHQIIIAKTATWNEQENLWNLFNGSQHTIDRNGNYKRVEYFDRLSVSFKQTFLQYIKNYRDNREMNLVELYQRLDVLQATNNIKNIRQLKVNIQERYALPFSCIVFAILGAVLGCDSQLKINSLTLTVIVISIYQVSQFLSTSLCLTGIVPVLAGVWLPNILGLIFSGVILNLNERQNVNSFFMMLSRN